MPGRHGIAMAALALAGLAAPAYAPPVSRAATMPDEQRTSKPYKREKRNSTPKNAYRRRPCKLARRLRRKHELGMNGAF